MDGARRWQARISASQAASVDCVRCRTARSSGPARSSTACTSACSGDSNGALLVVVTLSASHSCTRHAILASRCSGSASSGVGSRARPRTWRACARTSSSRCRAARSDVRRERRTCVSSSSISSLSFSAATAASRRAVLRVRRGPRSTGASRTDGALHGAIPASTSASSHGATGYCAARACAAAHDAGAIAPYLRSALIASAVRLVGAPCSSVARCASGTIRRERIADTIASSHA